MSGAQSAHLQEVTVAQTERRDKPRRIGPPPRRSFLITFIAVLAVAAFLSPFLRAFTISIKSADQISQPGSPLWPADQATFAYQGEDLDLVLLPIDGATREMAILERGRLASTLHRSGGA